jgi:hypothetical protein
MFTFVHHAAPMTGTDAHRFRQEADECRKLAERSAAPSDKEAWLRLAADWIKLAEEADQRRAMLSSQVINPEADEQGR